MRINRKTLPHEPTMRIFQGHHPSQVIVVVTDLTSSFIDVRTQCPDVPHNRNKIHLFHLINLFGIGQGF